MTIERRQREINRTLSPVSLLLCFTGLLAIAFSITLRDIQTATLPHQLSILHLTPKIFDILNRTCENTLIVTLILSGLIVDLIGPRTVLSIAIVVAMVANYFFSSSDSLQSLLAFRLLTEYSHIFVLMSILTLGSHWLPTRHFSCFVGLLFGTLLMVSVMVKTALTTIIATHGIEYTNIPIALMGTLILLLIIRTKPIPDMTRRRSDIYGHFNPLRYYKIWLIGLVAMIGWMTNTFLLRIGVYYLTWDIHFSVEQAMNTISIAFVFFGIGTMVMGIVSDFLEKKQNFIVASYCIAAIAFSAIIFIPSLSTTCVAWLLYVTAFFASSNIICYTKANDYCTVENSGIALGIVLSISTIGSSIFARTMHFYIEKNIYSASISSPHNWKAIVITVPIALLIGALISLFLLRQSQPLKSRR
jgi:predicted MFS family arabinose efflux permease